MTQHRTSDTLAPHFSRRVHRLQFGVFVVQVFQRANREQRTVASRAEERDRRVDEPIDVECVHVFWWALRMGEREVSFEQCPHVVSAWIVDRDAQFDHNRISYAVIPVARYTTCGVGKVLTRRCANKVSMPSAGNGRENKNPWP